MTSGVGTWTRWRLPGTVLTIYGGLGDELLLSAALRELRKRSLKLPTLAVTVPELFVGNADVDRVFHVSQPFLRMAPYLPVKLISPKYPKIGPQEKVEHFIETICRSVGVRGEIDLRPYMQLTTQEDEDVKFARGTVCIQSTSAAARWPIPNKEWGWQRYQQVVSVLQGRVEFIQVGGQADPKLEGARDLRGCTTPRQTAALIRASEGVLCNEGFLMHLARAVDRRAVVVYGGRILPAHSGYSANLNLKAAPPCSPCGEDEKCSFGRECLASISVEQAVRAVLEMVARRDEPLKVDCVELS